MNKNQDEVSPVTVAHGENSLPVPSTSPANPDRKTTQEKTSMTPTGSASTASKVVNEGLVSLARVASKLQVHSRTVARWCLAGVTGVDGQVHKLECARIGRKLRTSWPAVSRFLAAMQQADKVPVETPAPATKRERERASEQALRELKQANW